MNYPKSPLECVQDAWIAVIADFRAWLRPETKQSYDWKKRPFNQSLSVCRSQLVDDAEGMLAAWRARYDDSVEIGVSGDIPIMMTANAIMQQPPDVNEMRGVPYWLDASVANDPLERAVQVRTIPKSIRIQTVYFTTNPHDAASVMDQFCAYLTDDTKRRFDVSYHLGGGVIDTWQATILDNSLYPDNVASDAKNITIVSVDVTIQALVPHIVGLGGEWDDVTDNGHDDDGNMGGDNGGQDSNKDKVVVQADHINADDGSHVRVLADPETGIVTDQVIEP